MPRDPRVQAARSAAGVGARLTDAELEALAQTWSEHCKHKIFSARIEYEDEAGNRQTIDSLFKSFIVRATREIRAAKGKADICLSVFKDNAGVIRFNDEWSLVFKVETHNSPSALDPYGGALTGIVGVNRDSFGTGQGARLHFQYGCLLFRLSLLPTSPCRRACCIPGASSRGWSKGWSTAATRAASRPSTAPWFSTTACRQAAGLLRHRGDHAGGGQRPPRT